MNACAAPVSFRIQDSLWVSEIARNGWTEYLVGARTGAGSHPACWARDLARFLTETKAVLVELDGFGDSRLTAGMREHLAVVLPAGFPVSLMVNSGNGHAPGGGLLARAVAGLEVTPLYHEERWLGFRYEDGDADYVCLGGIVPASAGVDGGAETRVVMETIKACLAQAGLGFRDVVRTWYYLDDILSWYDGFNHARTTFFNEHEVFSRLMPASTGIGIANASGRKVLAKVHACRPKDGNTRIRVAESPLQCSAYDYGSAFSRAVEIATSTGRTLHISGTASIAPGGETEHVGDLNAQITRTLEVVGAILTAAGMGWSDTVRGIAYFNTAAELPHWAPARGTLNLPPRVELVVHADICRTDLLFELELEAFRPA